MDWAERVEIDPKIMMGKPVIKGTRIPVSVILNLLADGYTATDIKKEYPDVTAKDITAVLRFAARTSQFEELRTDLAFA